MGTKSMLKLGYAWMAIQGLLSLLVPRRMLKMATMGWRAGFENVDELEPRDWYVEMTRALGVGMLAAGVAGILLQRSGEDEAEDTGVDSSEDDESDDPIEVDVD